MSEEKEPESFSKDYVRELREENKGWRLKAQEQEGRARAEGERAAKALQEAEARMAAMSRAADERIVRSELRALAVQAGMIDLDGLKLADLSSVRLNEQGEVEGAEALMASLREAKPYLFGVRQSSASTQAAPQAKRDEPRDARTMTEAEYKVAVRQFGG